MQGESGYDVTATTNMARFQGQVLLRLARNARPDGPPIYIHHDDWYHAYRRRVGDVGERAPVVVRLAHENEQDTWIEYRRERVVRSVRTGAEPDLAVNVVSRVPPQEGERFSYDDERSRPKLKITVEPLVRYRLLAVGDMIVFDQIEGLRGRPTTGVLGALFRLIGEARAVDSRLAFAADGSQVVIGTGRKGFLNRTATVTVAPDGTADRGIPPNREDLVALEELLMQPLEIEYVPWSDEP
jgi:hypothetical protein